MTDEEHDNIISRLQKRTWLATQVYKILCVAAEKGGACPSNAEICTALQHHGNPTNISCCLKTLHKAGLITVVSGTSSRKVTITRTGHSTQDLKESQMRPVNRVDRSGVVAMERDPDLAGTMISREWIEHVQKIIRGKLADGVRV